MENHTSSGRHGTVLRCLLVFLLCVNALAIRAESSTDFVVPSDSIRISLLTCSRGNDIASTFGHSAIRMIRSRDSLDIVFNYGTYDFDEPDFILKFVLGKMRYMLAVSYTSDFISDYSYEGREVREQVLNLTAGQKQAVTEFLFRTWNGPDRYYRYDYFVDNCATRIRDLFIGTVAEPCDSINENFKSSYSFRSEYNTLCLYDWPWLRFGLDLVLGARIDKPLTFSQEMFLPQLLEGHFSHCVIAGKPLVSESSVIVPMRNDTGEGMSALARLTSPFPVFTLLSMLYVTVFLALRGLRRDTFVRFFSRAYFALLGVLGCFFLFMWFGTDHWWTGENWNLCWANPLFLVPAIAREGRVRRGFIIVTASLSLLAVFCQSALPQAYNIAVVPIVVLIAMVALSACWKLH